MATRTLGKYRLIAELGHGGMAEVFLAMIGGPTGTGFTKLAVVKRLRPNLVEDPEFVSMLVDEARITARLNHPNVVQTLEVGVEGEEYFLAMEFLDGQPLHRIQRRALRGGTAVPREFEYLVVADTLAGLEHAHELADYDGAPLGVVHRDVTPQNIFVTYDGIVKVVDFGIAKAAGRSAETKAGIVKGKVRYMSPEQALGGHIDRRSDVFAAGILLWEAATGKRYWRDKDDFAIVQKLIAGDYDPSPRAVDPNVPQAIDTMCCRAMAFRPEDRYATAADLRADIESFMAAELIKARRTLGPYVASLFAKERGEIRKVIERAGKQNVDSLSIAHLVAAGAAGAPSNTSSSPVSLSIAPMSAVSAMSGSLAPAATLSPPARDRRPTAAFVGAAAMFLVASIVFATGLVGKIDVRVGVVGGEAVPRAAAQVDDRRTELKVRSATGKGTAEAPSETLGNAPGVAVLLAATSTPAPQVAASPAQAPARAAFTPAGATSTPAASSASSAPAASAATGNSGVLTPVPPSGRRNRATIDTGDPWQVGTAATKEPTGN